MYHPSISQKTDFSKLFSRASNVTFTRFLCFSIAGNYSVYGLAIHLSRCVSPYLLNVYLPTAIFVVMSW